jgi:hypothetical protein
MRAGLVAAPLFAFPAMAELRPGKVHTADSKKNLSYIRDGIFVGGDRAIDQVAVKGIRRSSQAGYERIVIDLEGTKGGEPAAIPRPPFYQVAVNPEEKRLVLTISGRPRLEFDAKKVSGAFSGSPAVQKVVFLPKVEEDSWTSVFELKSETPVEVFELVEPVRIIVDLKTAKTAGKPASARSRPAKPARASKPENVLEEQG